MNSFIRNIPRAGMCFVTQLNPLGKKRATEPQSRRLHYEHNGIQIRCYQNTQLSGLSVAKLQRIETIILLQ